MTTITLTPAVPLPPPVISGAMNPAASPQASPAQVGPAKVGPVQVGPETVSPAMVSQTVAARLFSAERAIDLALAETAGLMILLPSARAQTYLSAVTGQKAFDGTAASIAALTQARSHIVATHNALAALARKLGLDDLAVGPLDKPEDDHGITPETGRRVGPQT